MVRRVDSGTIRQDNLAVFATRNKHYGELTMKAVYIDNHKTLRMQAGLSLNKLAKLTGFERDVIADIERHWGVPETTALQIIEKLNELPAHTGTLDPATEISDASRYGNTEISQRAFGVTPEETAEADDDDDDIDNDADEDNDNDNEVNENADSAGGGDSSAGETERPKTGD
jgi:transcriptional regulator with XRE-family HTH domain